MDVEQHSNIDSNTISGKVIDVMKYIGTSVFSFVFEQYLSIVNTFLTRIQEQLKELVPEGSPAMDRYRQSQLISAAINEVFKDPVFKAQLDTFTANIRLIIEPFLREMNELLAKEGNSLADSAFKITNRVARNAMAGVLEGVEGALTLFPGVGTVIDLLNVLQGFIDSASVISVEFFSNMSKVMQAFLRVYGETAGPIVDTVKSVEELFNNIKAIQQRVNQKVEAVTVTGGKKKRKTRRRRRFMPEEFLHFQ